MTKNPDIILVGQFQWRVFNQLLAYNPNRPSGFRAWSRSMK